MAEQRSTPIPDLALTADINDGEFRTYALICQLCWRNHPKAERPYTELGYEELARLHPGNGLRAAAVRASIQHLVQLGLLVRERFDNVRWRTYPVVVSTETEKLGAIPASTHSGLSEMGATLADTQMAQQDSWVLSHVAPNCKPEPLGVIPDSTQRCKHELGAMPASTQSGLSEMGAMPANTQPAPDLTDLIDPDQDQINQSDQGGVGGMDLLTLLSKLNPEPMSAEGIRECLHQPQLTAAWLAYVNDPGNGVQNPAAYLRRQVRRGKYPPLQAAACLPIPVERRAHEQTRTLPNQLARPAAIAPALASLAVAPVAAPRWPLDAS